jgi:hypothetical protein
MEGRRVVRFFLELPERVLGEYVAKLIEASMDVEVVEAQPPRTVYERCLDLELAKHYSVPICPMDLNMDLNPVDGIIEALSRGVAAFEVVARGDPGAKYGIRKYLYERTRRRPGLTKALTDIAVDFLGEATIQRDPKDISREAWWRYGRQWKGDPLVRKELLAAEEKLGRNHFTCEVKAYGGRENVKTLLDALPSIMNRLRRFKTTRKVEAPSRMVAPSKHRLRNAFSNLWKIAPPAILAAAYHFGLFNPLRLSWIDMLVSSLAIASIFPLLALLRKRNPIVLSVEELSLIVGLPTSGRRLPIELGGMPLSRKSLAKSLSDGHEE